MYTLYILSCHWTDLQQAVFGVILDFYIYILPGSMEMPNVNLIQISLLSRTRLLSPSGVGVFTSCFISTHFWHRLTAGKMKGEFSAVFKWIMFDRWSLRNKLFIIKLLIIGMLVWTQWNCKDGKNNHILAWSSLISPPSSSTTPYTVYLKGG